MQRLKLDINPTGEIPVLHVAQYDKGRLFQIELVDGEQAYNVPSEYSVQLNVRKTDSKLVTKAPETITDNILTFATSEQMTVCPGENIASVTLKDADDYVITTLYFLISVQRDVLAGGLDSASEIHNLEQQIAAIVPEVIGEDYYNKGQTDALLANKANMSDLADLASKAELEYAIDEEDAALKDWAITHFATPGYIASRYYNKTQVDELLFNMLPIDTASGNPCSFNTEISAVLQALTAEIVASGGNGTPSTPIPLVGHTELNLTRCGKNLNPYSGVSYVVSNDRTRFYLGAGTYTFSNDTNTPMSSGANYYIRLYDAPTGGNIITSGNITSNRLSLNGDGTLYYGGAGYETVTFTLLTGAWVCFGFNNIEPTNCTAIQLEVGSTATEYEPYNGQTFTVAFGQTVYGGVYDKSGSLTITHGFVTYDGSNDEDWTISGSTFYCTLNSLVKSDNYTDLILCDRLETVATRGVLNDGQISAYVDAGSAYPNQNWIYIRIDSIASVSDLRTWLSSNNLNIAYKLATPIEIDVQAVSPSAIEGTNTITSDCNGDVNVSYKDSIQHYIDTRG